jgi:hypothetical protein
MKFTPAEDDDSRTMMTHRLVSENQLIEIGVYRVAYGWRVRAGFVNASCCELDWCGGSNWKDVERLYSLCYAVLEKIDESKSAFIGLPGSSRVKPFYHDLEFVGFVGNLAGDFEMIKLEQK